MSEKTIASLREASLATSNTEDRLVLSLIDAFRDIDPNESPYIWAQQTKIIRGFRVWMDGGDAYEVGQVIGSKSSDFAKYARPSEADQFVSIARQNSENIREFERLFIGIILNTGDPQQTLVREDLRDVFPQGYPAEPVEFIEMLGAKLVDPAQQSVISGVTLPDIAKHMYNLYRKKFEYFIRFEQLIHAAQNVEYAARALSEIPAGPNVVYLGEFGTADLPFKVEVDYELLVEFLEEVIGLKPEQTEQLQVRVLGANVRPEDISHSPIERMISIIRRGKDIKPLLHRTLGKADRWSHAGEQSIAINIGGVYAAIKKMLDDPNLLELGRKKWVIAPQDGVDSYLDRMKSGSQGQLRPDLETDLIREFLFPILAEEAKHFGDTRDPKMKLVDTVYAHYPSIISATVALAISTFTEFPPSVVLSKITPLLYSLLLSKTIIDFGYCRLRPVEQRGTRHLRRLQQVGRRYQKYNDIIRLTPNVHQPI